MKIIPLILIVTGGIMVYAGMNGDNPLTVLKGVLTGSYVPTKPPSWNELGNQAASAGAIGVGGAFAASPPVASSSAAGTTNAWGKLGNAAHAFAISGTGITG